MPRPPLVAPLGASCAVGCGEGTIELSAGTSVFRCGLTDDTAISTKTLAWIGTVMKTLGHFTASMDCQGYGPGPRVLAPC